MDVPVGRAAGLNGGRERLWGFGAGLFGVLVAAGTMLVPWLADDTPLHELWGLPYPPLFTSPGVTTLDYYLLGVIGLGLVVLEGAVVALRRCAYPRTDGVRATLLGTILCAAGGGALFVRLWAVTHR